MDTADRPTVLVVGRGHPLVGGIPTFMHGLIVGPLAQSVDFAFLNLAGDADDGAGGKLTVGNVARTGRDVVEVWRAAAGADIVHIHSAIAPTSTIVRAGTLAAAARLRGAKVLIHAHGGRFVSYADRPHSRLVGRVTLGPAHRVIAVAEPVRRALESSVHTARVELLVNGVDIERFTPCAERRPDRPVRILFVGHLTERKGVLDLLAASAELNRRGVEHELLIVGGKSDDGTAAANRVLDAIANAPANVAHLGAVEPADMPAIYRDADVFCLPSWWEAAPLSVLEAMASGLAVVASDVGDVESMLSDGAGIVVAPKDRSALADALQAVITDFQKRTSMASTARRTAVERYDARGVFAGLLEIYLEMVDEQ